MDSVAIYKRAMSAEEVADRAQECIGSGNTYQCGEIRVTRTQGTGIFSPEFDSDEILFNRAVVFRDSGCGGFCLYRLNLKGTTITTSVKC